MSKKRKQQKVFGLGDLHAQLGFNKPKSKESTKKSTNRNASSEDENAPNLGWLFFKEYYQGFDFSKKTSNRRYSKKEVEEYQNNFFTNKNNYLFGQSLNKVPNHLIQQKRASSLELTTVYPGLATGIGITHESKSQGEIKLGFAFDHTSGSPYIPASSVKGLLRSVFPLKDLKKTNQLAAEHRQYLIANLEEIGLKDLAQRMEDRRSLKELYGGGIEDYDFIDLLGKELFEGRYPKKKEQKLKPSEETNWEWKALSVYERDIFHDAYPSTPAKKSGEFLGADFITPHTNPLKNPTPIQFMKILPGVVISFQFDVKNGLLTKQEKLDFFKILLKDLGIGAKTNVGYGQLV